MADGKSSWVWGSPGLWYISIWMSRFWLTILNTFMLPRIYVTVSCGSGGTFHLNWRKFKSFQWFTAFRRQTIRTEWNKGILWPICSVNKFRGWPFLILGRRTLSKKIWGFETYGGVKFVQKNYAFLVYVVIN